MADVILKGELHSSRGDLNREREILVDGVSSLVLEGNNPESEDKYSAHEGWFWWIMSLFGFVMAPLYQPKEVPQDLAKSQDADVYYTRDTDFSLLRNAPIFMQGAAAGIFYLFFIIALVVGIYSDNILFGTSMLWASILLPLVSLRLYNMYRNKTENRDMKMAEIIEDAVDSSDGRVLAIVGEKHLEGVIDNIPERIEVNVERPEYSIWSFRFVIEFSKGILKAFGVSMAVYLVIVYLTKQVVFLLPYLTL